MRAFLTLCAISKSLENLVSLTASIQVSDFANGSDNLIDTRNSEILEILCVGHRYVLSRNTLDGSVQIIESLLRYLAADLGAYTAERMRLFRNHYSIRFLD